jgi:hypothetical protein
MFEKLLKKIDDFLKKHAQEKPCCCGKCNCSKKKKKIKNK